MVCGIDLFDDPQLVVGNRRGSWSAVIVAAAIIARKRAEIYIAGRGGGGAGGGAVAPTGSPSGQGELKISVYCDGIDSSHQRQ